MAEKNDPARFHIEFNFKIIEQVSAYDTATRVRCHFEEQLPVGVDAEHYLRKRIGEEIRRNFTNLKVSIDNAPIADPLEVE